MITTVLCCTGLAVFGCVVAVIVAVRRRVLVVTVRGSSMEPTYRSGDRVLARRVRLDHVRVGDVVVIGVREPREFEEAHSPHAPGADWIIKRAAALPGDPVPREGFAALAHVPETAVPQGKLVVLGDSPHSADSRLHGYYQGDRLAGVVVRKLRAGLGGG